jgi:hypothetical protein
MPVFATVTMDHHDGLDRLVRILVAEFRERIDVEEAKWVGAGGDARNAGDRARTGIDRDVEAFGLVVALVDRDEVGGGRTLEFPIERELDRGLRRCAARQAQDGHRQRCTNLDPLHHF